MFVDYPKRTWSAVIALTGFFCLTAASAEPSIPVVPGEYELINDLVDTKTTNCFKGDRLSAEVIRNMMSEQEGNENCEIVGSSMEGEQLIVDLACQYDATEKGTGTMRISSSKDTVTINAIFRLTVEGQERSMEMTSVGKRIGGC